MNAIAFLLVGAARLCGAGLAGMTGAGILWLAVELDNEALQEQNAPSLALNTFKTNNQ